MHTRVAGSLVLALGLSLTACSSSGDGVASGGSDSAAPVASASAEQALFNDTDVRFTQSMLPHHMQAVRNTEIEIAQGSDPAVKKIAMQILEAQKSEIKLMQGFLDAFGAQEKPAPEDQQAVWDANTKALQEAKTPEARDVIFLTNMVPHHSAAIPMAQNEIVLGKYEPAISLAMGIKTDQRMEIKMMNEMIRMRTAALAK